MDNYQTPNWIIDGLFRDWFDPCPLNPNPSINGLLIEWEDRTFVNPPYSDPINWVAKAIEESNKGKTIALLLKLDCSTKWYYLLEEAEAHIIFIGERVKFNGKSPPFCNMIAVLYPQNNTQNRLEPSKLTHNSSYTSPSNTLDSSSRKEEQVDINQTFTYPENTQQSKGGNNV